VYCQRPFDPWFDADCCQAKRFLHRLERAAPSASERDDNTVAAVASSAWIAQRCTHRVLLYGMREAFWRSTESSQQESPNTLWNKINNLLGHGSVPPQDALGADKFHRVFDEKMENARASTAGAPAPAFSTTAALLPAFQPVSAEDVINAIR
jgi:hypothetical protein